MRKFPDELEHLDFINNKLSRSLGKLDRTIESYNGKCMELRHYRAGYWNEMDSMERFSNEQSIMQTEKAGNVSISVRRKVEKLMDSPYFGRIDFRYDEDNSIEEVYIGSYSFTDDDDSQMLIYDWRAPISSLNYDG